MRTGNDPKPSLKPKISIFAQSCGGNRFTFPTLQPFVTLNSFQGRKGGDYQLHPCDSEINSEWQHALYHLAIKQPQNRSPPQPSPTRGGSSRCNTSVLLTNAGGERPQASLKAQKSHFFTTMRWEPLHFSHPTNLFSFNLHISVKSKLGTIFEIA